CHRSIWNPRAILKSLYGGSIEPTLRPHGERSDVFGTEVHCKIGGASVNVQRSATCICAKAKEPEPVRGSTTPRSLIQVLSQGVALDRERKSVTSPGLGGLDELTEVRADVIHT